MLLRIFDMQKSYRFLSGVDDATFCQRVSDVLAEGYILYGNPVIVMDGGNRIVGQAVEQLLLHQLRHQHRHQLQLRHLLRHLLRLRLQLRL